MAKKERIKIKSLYLSEFIILIVLGVFFLFGFVTSILGMFAFNYGKLADNELYQFQKEVATFFKLKSTVADFRIIGTIIMVVIMLFFLICVYIYSSIETKEIAQKRRQEERQRILQSEIDLIKKE